MHRSFAIVANKVLVLIFASIFSIVAIAQGTGAVIESQAFTPGQQPLPPGSVGGTNNDGLSLLLEQNQQLRTEVQALRALVEEQGFEIRKMQRDSLNRYTNLDERLGALEGGLVTETRPGNRATDTISSPDSPTEALPDNPERAMSVVAGLENDSSTLAPRSSARVNRGTLQPAILSEQQLYQMAYDSVINSNFERSIAEFDQYLSIYPEGRFVTNTYYWKGQAYLYLNRFTEARDSYEIILEQYEESPKLPDAMYGLGLAYQGLGNIAQARQLLSEIKRRFPNTGVANLADTRLLSLD